MDTLYKVSFTGGMKEKYKECELYARDLRDLANGLCFLLGQDFKDALETSEWCFKEEVLEDYTKITVVPEIKGELSTIGAVIGGLGASKATVTAVTSLGGLIGTGTTNAIGVVGATAGTAVVDIVLSVAASAALSAISQAISAKKVNYADIEQDKAPSFLYNGVVNTVEQGHPVPLVFGKHLTGSVVISVNMSSEELGEASNEIDAGDLNFYGNPSSNWSAYGAQISDENGILRIHKTSTNSYGGAILDLSLAPDTQYELIVVYRVEHVKTTFLGHRKNWQPKWKHTYQKVYVQVESDGGVIAESIVTPTTYTMEETDFTATWDYEIKLPFTSTSGVMKGLFHLDPKTDAFKDLYIVSLKIQKVTQ